MAFFYLPAGRAMCCNPRFHRFLEEVGSAYRPNLHWQEMLTLYVELCWLLF